MIRFKSSVKIHPDTLQIPQMIHMLSVVQAAAPQNYDITVTSACDSQHKDGSKHYTGKALDFRTKDFPQGASLKVWLGRIQARLGDQYFAQLEEDHLHVQYNA